MYELVKVRVYAVGPSQARFDATLDLRIASTRNPTSLGDDNGDREAFIASLITGLNAAGKTLLASMIQVALEPRLLDQYIANSRWHDIVAANRIGQIILECRQTRDGKRLIIGLAMERQTSGARPNVGHYIIHPERDFDL